MALSFSEKTFYGLIFLPVQLNGHRLTAMFDTGAGMTVMPQRTAKIIGLKGDGGARRGGNNGGQLSLETGAVETLRIDAAELRDWTVGILPDGAFDVSQDGAPFPADLFLGWDVISRFCWEFDMGARQVHISPGGSMPGDHSLTWDRFPIFQVRFAGSNLPLGFDCGHTETMLDLSWKSRLPDLRRETTVTVGIGSTLEESVSLVPRLALSISGTAVTLENVEVLDRPIPGARPGSLTGLLGVDVVQGRRWTLDAKSQFFRLY